ncbi:hypothetical protein MTO96_042597 [Rhipicephalus appendiculatus]
MMQGFLGKFTAVVALMIIVGLMETSQGAEVPSDGSAQEITGLSQEQEQLLVDKVGKAVLKRLCAEATGARRVYCHYLSEGYKSIGRERS